MRISLAAFALFSLALPLGACGASDESNQAEGDPPSQQEPDDGESAAATEARRQAFQQRLKKLDQASDEISEAAAIRELRGWFERERAGSLRNPAHLKIELASVRGEYLTPHQVQALANQSPLPTLIISCPFFPPVTPWIEHTPFSKANLQQLAMLAK